MKKSTSFEHIAEIWDAKTGDKAVKMVSATHVTAKNIIAELGNLKNKSVYEIACGNGFLARKLAPQVKEMRASDISKTLIEMAKTKYDSKNIKYEVRSATDFNKLPKNHFDAVIIHAGIFYVDNIAKLAQGIHMILKKGGLLIYSDMHPLMYVVDLDIGMDVGLSETLEKYRLYLKNRKKEVSKKWLVGDEFKQAIYYQFKRPLSYYINILAEHGLPTVKIIEPKTITSLAGKIKKSTIPAEVIVKCQKF